MTGTFFSKQYAVQAADVLLVFLTFTVFLKSILELIYEARVCRSVASPLFCRGCVALCMHGRGIVGRVLVSDE
jgi:hypothetical protein